METEVPAFAASVKSEMISSIVFLRIAAISVIMKFFDTRAIVHFQSEELDKGSRNELDVSAATD